MTAKRARRGRLPARPKATFRRHGFRMVAAFELLKGRLYLRRVNRAATKLCCPQFLRRRRTCVGFSRQMPDLHHADYRCAAVAAAAGANADAKRARGHGAATAASSATGRGRARSRTVRRGRAGDIGSRQVPRQPARMRRGAPTCAIMARALSGAARSFHGRVACFRAHAAIFAESRI